MGLWHVCEHEPPCGETYDAERYDRPRDGLKAFKEAFTAVLDPKKARSIAGEILERCREAERSGAPTIVRDLMLELGVDIGDLVADLEKHEVLPPGYVVIIGQAVGPDYRFRAGDRVRPTGGFGSPYLAEGLTYEVKSVDGDGSIRLHGRLGAWWGGGFDIVLGERERDADGWMIPAGVASEPAGVASEPAGVASEPLSAGDLIELGPDGNFQRRR